MFDFSNFLMITIDLNTFNFHAVWSLLNFLQMMLRELLRRYAYQS